MSVTGSDLWVRSSQADYGRLQWNGFWEMTMTSLDVRMNEGIDRLIAQLEAIKAQEGGYSRKVVAVDKVAEEAKNYADYWDYKLTDWASD